MTTIDWRPMAEFVKDPTQVPNRLVFLRVTKVEDFALHDAEPEKEYSTMGNWRPDEDGDGQWISVGWDWEVDEFCSSFEFEPVAWAEIPE